MDRGHNTTVQVRRSRCQRPPADRPFVRLTTVVAGPRTMRRSGTSFSFCSDTRHGTGALRRWKRATSPFVGFWRPHTPRFLVIRGSIESVRSPPPFGHNYRSKSLMFPPHHRPNAYMSVITPAIRPSRSKMYGTVQIFEIGTGNRWSVFGKRARDSRNSTCRRLPINGHVRCMIDFIETILTRKST